eukprot:TRINITY_DN3423_c0_g1_i1.p1 TRINITY_DN3423_c0_g1~~TRINITY_DN3423_c0_g1_i1.p1  ORF type:complete len:472 (-),score=91.83 TRINITY_DN3423_c0_g1_i1:3-1418(-)
MSVTDPLLPNDVGKSWNLKLIGRIGFVFVGCVLASGTLSGFPTIQPLLADAGAFAELGSRKLALDHLSSVYTVASGVSVGAFLFVGWLYDRVGPRWAGVFGAAGSALGMMLMAVSLLSPSVSWLLYVALPFTDTAGALNSMSLFGFIWHAPRHQATILGVDNSATQLTAAMAFVLVALVRIGLPLSLSFVVFALLSAIAAAISGVFAPSRDEFFTHADAALGEECPRDTRALVPAIRDACAIMRLNRRITIVFFLSQAASYFLFQYWFAYYLQFAEAVFGEETGGALANGVSFAYAVCGAVLTPLLGRVLDHLGLFSLLRLVDWRVYCLRRCALRLVGLAANRVDCRLHGVHLRVDDVSQQVGHCLLPARVVWHLFRRALLAHRRSADARQPRRAQPGGSLGARTRRRVLLDLPHLRCRCHLWIARARRRLGPLAASESATVTRRQSNGSTYCELKTSVHVSQKVKKNKRK